MAQLKDKKKILVCAAMGYTIEAFLIPYLNLFFEEGFEVDCAANWNHHWNNCPSEYKKIHLPFSRNPLSIQQLLIIPKIIQLLKQEQYSLIYTHTPIASAILRIAVKLGKIPTPVIYEAHGFHFHQYGSKINNFLFQNLESYLSKYTAAVITINQDDYHLGKKILRCPVKYVKGIGVDIDFYAKNSSSKQEIRQQLNLPKDKFIIITVADFIPRKNIIPLIEIGEILKSLKIPFLWIIAGKGPLHQNVKKEIQNRNLEKHFLLPGHVQDLRTYYQSSDCFILLSLQEGLPRSLLEAGAMKLPAVVSNIRGNRDLIEHRTNSFIVPMDNLKKSADYINYFYQNPDDAQKIGEKLFQKIKKSFSIQPVLKNHNDIFNQILGENIWKK